MKYEPTKTDFQIEMKCVNTNIDLIETMQDLYKMKFLIDDIGMNEMLDFAIRMNKELKEFYQKKYN